MYQKEEIAMKTDTELQQHVMDELKWEPTIRAAEIGVAVKDGRAVAQMMLATIIHSSYKHGNTNRVWRICHDGSTDRKSAEDLLSSFEP
jgi:hypothetical protein